MPENEKSFIEQEELKMERRQFFKLIKAEIHDLRGKQRM